MGKRLVKDGKPWIGPLLMVGFPILFPLVLPVLAPPNKLLREGMFPAEPVPLLLLLLLLLVLEVVEVDGNKLFDCAGFNVKMEFNHPTTLDSSFGQQLDQHCWIWAEVTTLDSVGQAEMQLEHFWLGMVGVAVPDSPLGLVVVVGVLMGRGMAFSTAMLFGA